MNFGHTELPEEQQAQLRRAVRLAWLTIAFLVTAVTAVYLAMGSSQAMKAAWMEDMLSFIPPIAFLLAVHRTRRRPTPEHPYGYHRAVGIGHLVAATALVAMGAFMVFDSGSGLVAAEHPPVGLIEVGGQVMWSGWLMIAVLAYTAVPPVLLGRAKMPLAQSLHDRVLYADAEMNKADWMTAVGGIVGVARHRSGAVVGRPRGGAVHLREHLMDARAQTYDGHDPHPLVIRVDEHLVALPWVATARSRVRDQGHVFHVESFVVPAEGHSPTLADLTAARQSVVDLDWKIDDIVLVPVEELPAQLLPSVAEERAGRSDSGVPDATT